MANLAIGIAQHLGNVVAALTYNEAAGGNLFVDSLPTTPDRVVGIFNVGGNEPDSKLPYDPVTVMIVVRGSAGSPTWALDRWAEIYSALHGLRNRGLPNGCYVTWLLAGAAGPNRTGTDANNRPSYSTNYDGEILNPTSARETL